MTADKTLKTNASGAAAAKEHAITVVNPLPAVLMTLDHAELEAAMALCEQAHAITLPSTSIGIELAEDAALTDHAAANKLRAAIGEKAKLLEGQRLDLGRRILALKSQVDETFKAATQPLQDQRDRLAEKIAKADLAFKDLHQRRVAEAERLAREEEARRVAEAEVARAKALADAQTAASLDAMPDEPVREVVAETFDGLGAASVRPVQPVYVRPPPTTGVRISVRKVLRIIDRAKIPLQINGAWLWTLDERAVEKFIKAGMAFPGGAELVDGEGKAQSKGGPS